MHCSKHCAYNIGPKAHFEKNTFQERRAASHSYFPTGSILVCYHCKEKKKEIRNKCLILKLHSKGSTQQIMNITTPPTTIPIIATSIKPC